MTRQYKGMQEELLNRINQLEGTIQVCMRKNTLGVTLLVKLTKSGRFVCGDFVSRAEK